MNAQTSSSSTEATPTFARQLVERLSSRLENEKHELVLFLISEPSGARRVAAASLWRAACLC